MSDTFKKNCSVPCCRFLQSEFEVILNSIYISGNLCLSKVSSYKYARPHRHASLKSNMNHTVWKAPQEMSQACGLVFSGTVLLVPRETDSDSCLSSENRKALSLLRSLFNAVPFSPARVRGVKLDASVSASLCFTAVVKSVQGAGLGSGLGVVAVERA